MRNRTLQCSPKPALQKACYHITSRKQIFPYRRIFTNDQMFVSKTGKVIISSPAIGSHNTSWFNGLFYCTFNVFGRSIGNAVETTEYPTEEACRAALNMIDGDGLPPSWDFLRATIAKATQP